MGFLKSTKGSKISDYFYLQGGDSPLQTGVTYDLALYDDNVVIKNPISSSGASLEYKQIIDVFHGYKTEVAQKSKSPIGRALAGGILFGGAGAVVGAISGVGNKEKKDTKLYLIISYTDNKGKDATIVFEDKRRYKGKKIAQMLKELCGIGTHDISGGNIAL
jgi:hypothetical protein